MAINTSKTLLLEKQYLYVRASKGFYLEGTSTERIWTNTGYYRFLVDNVASSIGNSYVTIHYDSADTDFIAYCSDLFLEELQNSVVVAIENLETELSNFSDRNHSDIESFEQGVSGALQTIHGDISSMIYPVVPIHNTEPVSSFPVGKVVICLADANDGIEITSSMKFYVWDDLGCSQWVAGQSQYIVFRRPGKYYVLRVE